MTLREPRPPASSVEEALALILRSIHRQPAEEVPLQEAAGRVLAETVSASEDLWPFPRAAMDGVAVRASDLVGACDATPVSLEVVGAVFPGQSWPLPLEPGTAVRIATGAPVPPGADAVVPEEMITRSRGRVIVSRPVDVGRHVMSAGEEARAGEPVLRVGCVLRGGDLALIAAIGLGTVPVVRRAEVGILATGDELVSAGSPLGPGQVRESNTYALAAEVSALGAEPLRLGIAPDDLEALEGRMREGLRADALVICGGASVGERDLVRAALRRLGVEMKFAGVRMKPGSPVAFGLAGLRPVFALPGTPGAARIAFEVLVRPALCAMMGHGEIHRQAATATLKEDLRVSPGRQRYLWGRAVLGASGLEITPLSRQGTATLRSASEANALIVIEPGDTELPAGARVAVRLLVPSGLQGGIAAQPAVLSVVGAPGSGKTALIERLIPLLRRRGLAVAVVKHHAHMRSVDDEGTDTWRAEQAGAIETVLAGPGGAVFRRPHAGDPPVAQVLAGLRHANLVLVEGYSMSHWPKILVMREGVTQDRPEPAGPLIAVVSDEPAPGAAGGGAPVFTWQDLEAVADLVVRRMAPP
ncbi:MAG: molybdopterin-guanine dinucleotide biosynthesis protein B [Armatimonadetes bacterium]|nr:molybdopterin-guanine dinucleotide biosynthesis protein B [Armatimonadota bacterium]